VFLKLHLTKNNSRRLFLFWLVLRLRQAKIKTNGRSVVCVRPA